LVHGVGIINATFNKKSTVTFNNTAFSPKTIAAMSDPHPSMQRFYKAVKELRGISQKAAIARLFNLRQQQLDTWEDRGLSKQGALMAQKEIGCDANWLLGHVKKLDIKNTSWTPLPEPQATRVTEISTPALRDDDWPFQLINQKRLRQLRSALGPKVGAMAIQDIDNQLEIVVMKWEREIVSQARPSAG
jgi:hypothetical protein